MSRTAYAVFSLAISLIFTAPAQATNWAGFYLFGGVGSESTDYKMEIPILPASLYQTDYDSSGFQGIVGVKYDWDLQSRFVVGVGANAHWSNSSLTADIFPTLPGLSNIGLKQGFGYDLFSTMGYKLNDAFLVYGIVGWTKQDFTITATSTNETFDWSKTGFQYGGGFEFALNEKIHLNLEFRQTEFNTEDFNSAGVFLFDTTHQSVIAGLKFKLN